MPSLTHGSARAVLDAIDDAEIIRSRNPVLYISMARYGCNARELSRTYDLWFYGRQLPSRFQAVNPSPTVLGRRKRNRVRNSAARKVRRANR